MKKTATCLLALLLAALLTACGGGKDVDLGALEGELTSSAAFTGNMTDYKAADAAIAGTYQFDPDEVASAVLYCNTGTAEEIFLAQAKDDASAKHLEELCQTRAAAQLDWMKLYPSITDGVRRVEDAIVKRQGVYVALVVADDAAAAKSIVDSYMK